MEDSPSENRPAAPPERLKAISACGARREAPISPEIDAGRFVERYYAEVPPEDLAADPDELAAAALDHLSFARTRRPDTAKIRVFNPGPDEDGFSSRHTLVQLVNDDMPFLVDSVRLTLSSLGCGIMLTIHPIFAVRRDGRGILKEIFFADPPAEARRESFIRVEITRVADDAELREIEAELTSTMRDVRWAVEDWPRMLDKLREAAAELGESSGPPPELKQESCEFLEWLAEEHFTLLGYHEYQLVRRSQTDLLTPIPGTGLGILRDDGPPQETLRLGGHARDEARSTRPLIVTKTNARSRVHRPAPLDYISVKVFDKRGRPQIERRFLGLFTSAAYNELPRDIPLLRRKARRLIEQAGEDPRSHRGRMLQHIVDTFPRDDLFQASVDELARITQGILGLQERRKLRLFCRRDPFGRFYSCLVYLPRDQYNRRARERIEQVLLRGLGGTSVESDVMVSDSALARLTVIVRTDPSADRVPVIAALERELGEAVRTWPDRLRDVLLASYSEDRALALFRRFAEQFSAAYQEDVSPARGAEDLAPIERLADGTSRLEMRLFQAERGSPRLRFSAFSLGEPIPLFRALKLLENMGLRVLGERVYTVRLETGCVFIQDFEAATSGGEPVDAAAIEERFEECFARALRGEIDDDGFNSFVVSAALDWREAAVLRA
ncbi:MAG TPA: NAD-glutamate dehydrogenase, partial [Gammaproteobacteria bacterium]|nr:NAD-glutamate dehydrogenase [Gammaproteobacteria bacterium]